MKLKNITQSLAIGGLLASSMAFATEGGGSMYPAGAANFTCCALPPPGTYGVIDAETYRATELRDNSGNKLPIPGFKLNVNAVSARFVHVTGEKVLGGDLAVHAIVPMLSVDVAGVQKKTGLGDIVFGPALGWHHSPNLHTVAAIDIFAPTGDYSKTEAVNIGRNYWATHLLGGVSWIDPKGWNADAKVMYGINGTNKDKDYKSGNEFIVDYALGWGFGNGLTAGVGGYIYRQVTDDTGAGAASPNRGRSNAIGPSLKYDSGKGWFITAKYQAESGVRNRAAGDAFLVKAVFPF